jgi:hypothetical protein
MTEEQAQEVLRFLKLISEQLSEINYKLSRIDQRPKTVRLSADDLWDLRGQK